MSPRLIWVRSTRDRDLVLGTPGGRAPRSFPRTMSREHGEQIRASARRRAVSGTHPVGP